MVISLMDPYPAGNDKYVTEEQTHSFRFMPFVSVGLNNHASTSRISSVVSHRFLLGEGPERDITGGTSRVRSGKHCDVYIGKVPGLPTFFNVHEKGLVEFGDVMV